MRSGLAGVDGWIGAVERIQQLVVAELGDETEGAAGEGCFEQVALGGRAVGGGNNVGIEGHGDAPKKMGMHLPRGRWHAQGGKRRTAREAVEEQTTANRQGNSDQRMVTPLQVGEPGVASQARMTGNELVGRGCASGHGAVVAFGVFRLQRLSLWVSP